MERQRQPPVKDNWEDMTEEDWAKQILYLQNLPPVTPPEEDEWDKADREEEERLAKQEREKGEDFERFKALSAECEKVEQEIDELVGPKDAPVSLPGATGREMKDILTLAAQARDQLQLTQLDEGRALVTKISALIETTKKAVARRLEEAKKDVESLTGVIHKLNMISTTEWTELRLLGKKAGEAVAKGTEDYAKLVGDFRDAINLARTRTDQETLLARFKDKSNKPGSPELIAAYKACVTENVKEVVEMGFRDKLKLRLVEDKKDGDFKIDVKGGDDHAFDRHTREGIWGARKVLTAHPSQVAIFDSADALTKALKEAPTKRSAWKEQGGGRVDADVGPVHYQGVSLGGTVALFSVYPTNRNYNKKAVESLLERMIEAGGSFAEFCDELEKCR